MEALSMDFEALAAGAPDPNVVSNKLLYIIYAL